MESVVKTLKEAVQRIQAERRDLDHRYHAEVSTLEKRERLVQQAIDGFGTGSNGNGARSAATLSISPKFVKQVGDYLEETGEARQADIAANLDLNSGTVSVALRRLEADGSVQKGGKESGSQVWTVVRRPVARETIVKPGVGVSEGRKMEQEKVAV